MPAETIAHLVHRLIDYAGLFPPAALDMPAAVAEYARARQSADAGMLARFIVPLGRLEEFAAAQENAAQEPAWQSGDGPWPLSVLVKGSDPSSERLALDGFAARFRAQAPPRARIEAVEVKASSETEIAACAEAFAGLEIYIEIPHDEDPSGLLAAIAAHAERGARAKIRSGGITADAIPSAFEVARFLSAAARAKVAMKATAGLHHPLRGVYPLTYEPDSASATMHGYLNVFLAAALLTENPKLAAAEIELLLEERESAAFIFGRRGVRWRERDIPLTAIAAARENFLHSYGSCSFSEPAEELHELGFVPNP